MKLHNHGKGGAVHGRLCKRECVPRGVQACSRGGGTCLCVHVSPWWVYTRVSVCPGGGVWVWVCSLGVCVCVCVAPLCAGVAHHRVFTRVCECEPCACHRPPAGVSRMYVPCTRAPPPIYCCINQHPGVLSLGDIRGGKWGGSSLGDMEGVHSMGVNPKKGGGTGDMEGGM